jgi:hypothetical protein
VGEGRLPDRERDGRRGRGCLTTLARMFPSWVWMQVAIVVFVLAGAIIAIVKLA